MTMYDDDPGQWLKYRIEEFERALPLVHDEDVTTWHAFDIAMILMRRGIDTHAALALALSHVTDLIYQYEGEG